MRVVSISGIDVTGQEMSSVMSILQGSVGQVVVEAKDKALEEWC